MAFQSVRGFKDILPPESESAAQVENTAREVFKTFGFREIRLPTLESQELFVKSTGETTDIVEKEMFLLEDSGGRRLALRPEGTPGAVRAYLEHHLQQQGGRTKLFYIGSMFRAERPQKGRYREFEQIGAECYGGAHPAFDAEIILALTAILDRVGLKGRYGVTLNNLGCESSDCRPLYRSKLLEFLNRHRAELCEHCQKRIDRNPLRALDCKGDGPKLKAGGGAPSLEPCAACRSHFAQTRSYLKNAGVAAELDTNLVRGLDYYTRTVFELRSSALGSQDAIAGGGRYDGLVQSMGGPDTPAVGWALGVERVLLALQSGEKPADHAPLGVYVAVQERRMEERRPGTPFHLESLAEPAHKLLQDLRLSNISAEAGFGFSLKSQMRDADRLKARYAVIFGENEADRGECLIKDMNAKDSQWTLKYDEALPCLREKLRPAP